MTRFAAVISLAVVSTLAGCAPTTARVADPWKRLSPALWGAEAMGQMRCSFYLPDQHLYGEEIGPGRGKPKPAFVWPSSVMLSALVAAARVDPDSYLPMLREYVDALRVYRTNRAGVTGLDVWPAPKTPDRYYDDNAWMALALAEAYEVTHDRRDLEFATESLNFTLSGEDDKQGGGIYWHEDRPDRKHAVSCAPTICAGVLLYRSTGNHSHLETATRLYQWMTTHLREPDGLYADSIGAGDGKVDHSLYAYNTAMMIRAGCLLYSATKDGRYLSDAQRSAQAAAAKWVRPADGAIQAEPAMAHKLAETFLDLFGIDTDAHRRDLTARAIEYAHSHCRDPNGWYSRRWDDSSVAALDPIRLIDQASAARTFWILAVSVESTPRGSGTPITQ